MDKSFHHFTELFEQLGLQSDPVSIKQFIAKHSPLSAAVSLENASFWTKAQSTFIREQLLFDADWAEIIDQLNKDLR